jgi:hypothetical protein
MLATPDTRRMNSRDYTAWYNGPRLEALAKGPVQVGEPPVTTTALTTLARQLGGETSMANLGPGVPIAPIRTEEGAPRRWDYVPGYNIITTPRKYEGVGFATLAAFAENYDIARLCVEKRKDDMRSLTYSIRPRPIAGLTRAEVKTRASRLENGVGEVTGFFLSPNQEDSWGAWLVQWAHQLFTIDAATIYLRPTLGGELYGLEIIDGSSIFELIDEWGRLPEPPDPAYVQVIRGSPSGWWTRDQIIRSPYWQTPRSPYGSPPAEWIMLTANRALRRQTLDLSRFTEGTVPVGFLRAPEGWNMTQIGELEEYLAHLLAGNDVTRSRIVPIPTSTTGQAIELMNPTPSTEAEDWLMHVTCAAYGVNPRELGFTPLHGSLGASKGDAEVGQEISFRRSVRNPALHLKGLLDRVIAVQLGQPELELWFEDLDATKDRQAEAAVNKIYVEAGVLSVDEVREESLDLDGIGLDNYVTTPNGPILVDDLIAGTVGPAADAERAADLGEQTASGAGGPDSPSADPNELTTGQDAGTPAKEGTSVGKAAGDLALWQRKALRAMKDGRSPAVRFQSDAIAADMATRIGFALAKSTTPDGVRAAFTLVKAGGSAGPLVARAPAGVSAPSSPTRSAGRATLPFGPSGSPRLLYPSTLRPATPGARTWPPSSTRPLSSSR